MPESAQYLEASVEHGVLILTVTRPQIEGEETANRLREELLASVVQHAAKKVVLDLRRTRYVSSIAFWPLLALRRQLHEHGGRLIICGLTGAVHDVFMTTRMVSSSGSLNAPFEVADDRESAVERLRGPDATS